MEEAGVDKHWKIAGKIPAKGISCCAAVNGNGWRTNENFLTSLDELISILFSLFSENGDITRKDEAFWASAELVRKVLSRARLGEGIIRFSFPKKIRKKNKDLPARCAVELRPGAPTQIYTEWIQK